MNGGKLKFFLPVAAFIGLVALFYVGLFKDPTVVPSPFIGKPAPAFELPSLADPEATVSNLDMRGDLALFNVWASWCPGCAQEHEMLLWIAARNEVPIFGLNWKDERTAGLKWLQRRGNPYRAVAFDYDNIVGIDWGVYGAPETFLLDANGIILYKQIGPLTPEVWATEFEPRIAAARAGGEAMPAEQG